MVCDQSQADELITKRVDSCLELIDVKVVDHVIIGGGNFLSFAEKGLM